MEKRKQGKILPKRIQKQSINTIEPAANKNIDNQKEKYKDSE